MPAIGHKFCWQVADFRLLRRDVVALYIEIQLAAAHNLNFFCF